MKISPISYIIKEMKNILPILADFANGIFATAIASYFLGIDPTWHYIIGILFAMSPDLDAVSELFKRGRVSSSAVYEYDHREYLHFPILFIIIGFLLTSLSPFFGYLFLVASVLHFVNDLYGTGWGVAILWPFSKDRFKLFSRRSAQPKNLLVKNGFWDNLSDEERKFRFVVRWKNSELPQYIKKYGIDDWIPEFYLKANPVCVTEYIIFILSLFVLFIF